MCVCVVSLCVVCVCHLCLSVCACACKLRYPWDMTGLYPGDFELIFQIKLGDSYKFVWNYPTKIPMTMVE